jgi:rRNA maturation RNase YbeY
VTPITVQNRQRKYRVNRAAIRDLFRAFLPVLLAERPADTWDEISIIVTDDDGIAAINERALGHAGPTDVITLEYPPMPGTGEGRLAEVVVNLDAAWTVGPRHRSTPSAELALYLAHSCNHLCGWDDATPQGRARMRRRERRWIARLPSPPEDLFAPRA